MNMLKLHFEASLQYQLDAIASVVQLFEGAPYVRAEDRLFAGVCANDLRIAPEDVRANRDRVAKLNNILDARPIDELDFSVEMETGTGKTYVYLRTIFELNKAYGLSKFIILVPSVAVKEGVLKTLEIAADHFKTIYGVNHRAFAYDSKKPTMIRGYAQSADLQIMVMNVQAFNTDDRIINQERDSNGGEKLIELIRQVRPIIIMDEPQEGMDSPNMVQRLEGLNPLLKLRYSATHKVVKNLIHQLTPFDAYNKRLVKQVEVLSVYEENKESTTNIIVHDVDFAAGKQPHAKIGVMVRLAGGGFKHKTIKVTKDDDLGKKTRNPAYEGWVIDRVWKDMGDEVARIRFTNGTELAEGAGHGQDKAAIFREQIRLTIAQHFKKKERLAEIGVKVLSLFFIDRVANYVDEEGLIRRLFNECYAEEYKKKYGKLPSETNAVHGGYFAKTGKGEWTDSVAAMQKNDDVFDLIMRDKERLLSVDEPLEFLFSHSALGVGWDNPNVFNICTLNETESVIQKRQEIGRGLRICVDQTGSRVRDPEKMESGIPVNLLTVIPNQSYAEFVSQYQNELADEYGDKAKDMVLKDARRALTKVKRNKTVFESSDFDRLWEVISRKTKYTVHFDEQTIVDDCVKTLNSLSVPPPRVQATLTRITSMQQDAQSGITFNDDYKGEEIKDIAVASAPKVDLVAELAEETWLSMGAIEEILHGVRDQKKVAQNPVAFLSKASVAMKSIIKHAMVRCVRYEPMSDRYGKDEFKEAFETYQDAIKVNGGVYDHVVYDSSIEKRFAQDIDGENRVRCFIKLPDWYKIQTPVGPYNPDWALVIEKRSIDEGEATTYHFVVETKGFQENQPVLDDEERAKIACAIAHFKAIGLEEYYVTDAFSPIADEGKRPERKAERLVTA
jgi:type III restriction enzyme